MNKSKFLIAKKSFIKILKKKLAEAEIENNRLKSEITYLKN